MCDVQVAFATRDFSITAAPRELRLRLAIPSLNRTEQELEQGQETVDDHIRLAVEYHCLDMPDIGL